MKKSNTFTLKKLVLALALAGYTMSSAYAVMTPPDWHHSGYGTGTECGIKQCTACG
ncbi:Uncharacterised protein [Budvicia aquatica]|uniref:Uncharacterized protein n=1 Tax=Budvicia aquatica TaxID=82979 RepID=A0A484ZCN3_9GAMM|nr:hypothetical protein [Budvicia aquatica]VFS46150.1 Uncharacterised protein [Budvicia aquatica]